MVFIGNPRRGTNNGGGDRIILRSKHSKLHLQHTGSILSINNRKSGTQHEAGLGKSRLFVLICDGLYRLTRSIVPLRALRSCELLGLVILYCKACNAMLLALLFRLTQSNF